MRAVAYIRVSKEREDGYSPDTQIAKIKAYCEAQGLHIVEVFTDLDESGRKDDRPAWQAMLRRVAQGDIDRVVVYRLDRFSRDTADFMATLKRMREYGCEIASVNESFDTSTPMGRAMVGILAVFAQLESETIGERIRDNLAHAVRTRRIHLGARPPYGYDRIKGKLTINPEQAEIVRWIFQRYLKGDGTKHIAAVLSARGIPSPSGRPFWRYSTVRQMLVNPVYAGYIRWDDIIEKGEHEPIIDEQTWEEVQRYMAIRTGTQPRKKGKSSVLGGLLRCEICGRQGNIKASHANIHRYYCTTRMQANLSGCPNIAVDARSLEKALVQALVGDTETAKLWKQELERAKRGNYHIEPDTDLSMLERRRATLKRALENLFADHYEHGIITREQFVEANERYLRQLQEVEQQITELNLQRYASLVTQANVDEVLRQLELLNNWGRLSKEERRLALASLIEQITWNPEGVTVRLRYGGIMKLEYFDVWRGVGYFDDEHFHKCPTCGAKIRTGGGLAMHRRQMGH